MHSVLKRLCVASAMCVAAGVASFAAAAEASVSQPDSTESADSCAAAFATLMARQLKPEIEKSFEATPDSISEFVRGVAHAFDIKNVDTPYYMGVRMGFAMIDRLEQMQLMGFPITTDGFCRYLQDALNGTAMDFDTQSADDYLRLWLHRANPMPELEPLSPQSQADYLDDQKAREGVTETPSGLLFEVITEGEGDSPTADDTVRLTYTGRLADGTVFDSTERPVQFSVSHLVPGFTEGLKMMKTGGEYRIIIPPALGYGDTGAAGVIPPGAVLDFTIHLLDIVK